MARGLSYADAVKLLDDSRIVGALDRLVGGVLLAASAGGAGFVLSLFDAKAANQVALERKPQMNFKC